MRFVVILACIVYAASWFLPVLDDAKELKQLLTWSRKMEEAMHRAIPRPGQEAPVGPGSGPGLDLNSLEAPPEADSKLRGHDAARIVFEGLDAEATKTTHRIEVVWVNLANPLFAAGALLALLGVWRVASALAIVGLISASHWLYSGDITALRIPRLEPESFAIGYWLWLGSFAVLAAAALGGAFFGRD